MRSASAEFRRVMSQRRNFVNYADVTLTDSKIPTLYLQPKDFRLSGNSIIDDIVDGDNFSVGTALGKTVTIVLDNTDERFSLYDFYGAVFNLYVGLPLNDDGTRVEKIKIGRFTVITPATTGTLISFEAVDNMYKFDRLYEEVSTTYPRTLGNIVYDICMHCGVNYTYSATHFDEYSMEIATRPEGDFTCRQILSYVCQIACCYAKIDANGSLMFDWMDDVKPEGNADGGNYRTVYKPDGSYYTGDDLDGGTFAYNNGVNFDGGRFNEVMTVHNLGGSAKGVQVCTDDVVITGVKVNNGKDKDGNEQGAHVVINEFNRYQAYEIGDIVSRWSGDTYTLYKFTSPHTAGTYWNSNEVAETVDYDIAVNDNPFTVGREEYVAQVLATKLVGMKFRPFSLSYLQDPTIESGDWVIVEDIKRNSYKSFVTNVTFTTIGYMSISCNAQPPGRVASTYSSSAASAIVKQNRLTQKQISYYEEAVQQFNELVANGMGLHTYERFDEDGSRIFYMSDKPIEDEDGTPRFTPHSKVWKISSAGFALCQDAELYDTGDPRTGCQWTSGWDSQGNAVYNSLAAIGISFDWARGGTLTLGGNANQNGILSILDANGRERVRGDNTGIKIGDNQGSKIFLDTEGQMQYWFDGTYSGKMQMEARNYGDDRNPDIKDTLSVQEFDAIQLLTDNLNARVTLYNDENRRYGYVKLNADAHVEKDDTHLDGFSHKGGIHLYSDYININGSIRIYDAEDDDRSENRVILINDTSLFEDGHIYVDSPIYAKGYDVGDDFGDWEWKPGYWGWISSKEGNTSKTLLVHRGLVLETANNTEPVYDFWHEVNGVILIAVLGPFVTEVTWDNLEQPSGGGEYSFEPHIKPPNGVNAPMITGMKQNGNSLTVYITEVTEEQAGTEMKLRVIV